MQTFLPYPDFKKSAKVLDRQRLGKQRSEAMIIINVIRSGGGGWYHHTATRMWLGFVPCLKQYANAIIAEWEDRGYENNMPYYRRLKRYRVPDWLGDPRFHFSHRCNLVRKLPEYYKAFWPTADASAPYYWPSGMKNKKRHDFMVSYWKRNRIKAIRGMQKNGYRIFDGQSQFR